MTRTASIIFLALFSIACAQKDQTNQPLKNKDELAKDSLLGVIKTQEDLVDIGKGNIPELLRSYKTYATTFKDTLSSDFALKSVELSISEGNLVNAQSYLEIAEAGFLTDELSLIFEYFKAKLAFLKSGDENSFKAVLETLRVKAKEGSYGRFNSLIMKETVK